MQEYSLPRIHKDNLCFNGELVVTVDDREWLGVTANWWELSLYKTDTDEFVLGSIFYQNCPRGNTIFNADQLESLNDVKKYLEHSGTPCMIIDGLMQRAKRAMSCLKKLGNN